MLGPAELEAANTVLQGTRLAHGPRCREFEEKFAARVGAAHATSVSSCTAGMHLTLFCAGVGAGDEVIVPAMSHVATAHVVELAGARPVFVDVDAATGNLDPDALGAALDERTKAVMVVHYLGLPADMDRIGAAADAHGAFIVEDCALAVDATWDGRKVGTFGRAGCFSFYPTKHMTTLEGGMVTTNDAEVFAQLHKRKAFGYDRSLSERRKPGIYDVDALGYNYRMNEVQAAIGAAQVDRLDDFQRARARNFEIVARAIEALDEITVLPAHSGPARSSHYCLNALLPADGSIDRDEVVAALTRAGVGTSVHYPSAIPLFSYYREKYGYVPGQFPNAERVAASAISLPVGPHLDEEDAARVGTSFCEAVRDAR
jgi:dTDP-4-amino-4,6-dideoxygalactose transaminase